MRNTSSVSRRNLLKASGLMVVGFGMGSSAGRAQISIGSVSPQIAGPTAANSELDSWIAIRADNTATLYFGRGEFGQGTLTSMLMIAAEELDLTMRQVSAHPLDTTVTRDQGMQVSSSSIEGAAPSLRAAAAEARQALLQLAATRLGTTEDKLRVSAGVVSVVDKPGRSVTYGELLGDNRFNIKVSGTARLKSRKSYELVGTRVARVDIPDKISGRYEYMQYVRVPGMLHGRIVRPQGQGALGAGAKIKSIDEASIAEIPGAQIVRKGDFLGVVAPNEWHAVKAASKLKVVWDMPPALSGSDRIHERLKAGTADLKTIDEAGDPNVAFAAAAHQASGTFKSPYESHAPFAPNCAIADVSADAAEIICSTQTLYPARGALAKLLNMKPEQVRVRYAESSGTYGHSCYDDVAQAAALLSQGVGKPVRVQFSRGDEHGWDSYGQAHLAEVRAGADATGQIVSFEYHGWQHGWNFAMETSTELALNAKVPAPYLSAAAQVNKINTAGMYEIANKRLISHNVAGLDGYLKASFLRSPLDLSISFASEQIIDELAFRAALDPAEFRRRNITNPRWRGVLDAVTKAADWHPRVAAARKAGDVVSGVGVALGTHWASYGAAVAEVDVNRKTGVITVRKLFGAIDAGAIVNPAAVEQQVEGMMIQATSRILHEEVQFDESNVTSLDWFSYPILRFSETPTTTAVVVSRPDEPSLGAGEEVLAAAGAAIANAFFDATGVRLHERPITPERVMAALKPA
jgi:nicotinate dehydrogenase subunit B